MTSDIIIQGNLMTKAPKTSASKTSASKTAAGKAAVPKTSAPKTTAEKATVPKTTSGKPNALQKPLQLSDDLTAVVGPGPLSRGEVVSKVWSYIKSNNLQNPQNRREILADDKLRKVLGKDKVTMFEMNKHLAQHLT
jgi:upstream activation factor subunit UAF30